MAGVRKKPIKGGKYQGWFIDTSGSRKFFTGTRSRAETLRIAQRLEDDHRQIRLGYRPVLQSVEKHKKRAFAEVKDEYLAWGTSQGGRDGRPWSATHAQHRRAHLGWWQKSLQPDSLADFEGLLPHAEGALRDLQARGLAGKTLTNYAETLAAFCDWCVQRGYLASDPLKSLKMFDTMPQSRRRGFTPDEISRLLEVCPPHRKPLYETALMSGLRVNELRHLVVDHLDRERFGLWLDAEWTKNRKSGFQPLPAALVERLYGFTQSDEVERLYARFYGRKDATLKVPDKPLLYVPILPVRVLNRDLQTAGIEKQTASGKLDFHSLRVTYINLVIESGGVSVKEAQELARHATPELTMNVYGRTREERLSQAVEKIAQALLR